MSLIAWFPLQGDLHNQGLDTITLIKSDPTFTDDGKIGKCLSSGHKATEYFTPPSLVNAKQLSITYWARIDIATTTNRLDGFCWYSTADGTTTSYSRQEFYSENTDKGTMNVGIWYAGGSNSGYTISLYDWHHYALILDYSTGISKFYVDGELKNIRTTVDTTHRLTGKMRLFDTNIDASECDVRVFNHCLSDKEVMEIAKGLVAHYELSEPLQANDTIIYDCSGYNHHGTPLGTLAYSNDTARYGSSTNFDGNTGGILFENFYLGTVINNDITYSFWIKPNNESGARSIYFDSYGGHSWSLEKNANDKLRLYWDGNPDETCSTITISDGVWQHICITKKGTDDVKVYYNGVLAWTSTAAHNIRAFPTTYRMGRDYRSGDGTPYKGLMSDFRIYATALSAEDALGLYQTAGSIDNNGNIYAYELKEG